MYKTPFLDVELRLIQVNFINIVLRFTHVNLLYSFAIHRVPAILFSALFVL